MVFIIILLVLAVFIVFGIICRAEAEKQGRNGGKWFVLGFLFNINAIIGLKLSKLADEEVHSIELWSFFGVVFGITAVIAFLTALNAEKRGNDFDCWSIIGFMFGWIGYFASLFLKPFAMPAKVETKENE